MFEKTYDKRVHLPPDSHILFAVGLTGEITHHLSYAQNEVVAGVGRFQQLPDCSAILYLRPGDALFNRPQKNRCLPLNQRIEYIVLVIEVLVERPNAYPGSLGDTVGGRALVSPAFQNLSRSFDDCVDGSLRTSLRRLSALNLPVFPFQFERFPKREYQYLSNVS